MEEVLDTKFDDEMETLRVISSQVGKLNAPVASRNWSQVEEHVRQLDQKLQDELNLAQTRHEVHLDLFKQEETKVKSSVLPIYVACNFKTNFHYISTENYFCIFSDSTFISGRFDI